MSIKTKTQSVKKFVVKHKTALTITATSVAWIVINQRALEQHNEFLKEKGLYEEFYTPAESE